MTRTKALEPLPDSLPALTDPRHKAGGRRLKDVAVEPDLSTLVGDESEVQVD